MSLDVLKQRVPLSACARCRKAIQAGDRVLPAYIVKTAKMRHPETKELVSELSGDFEFVHASCSDPTLEGKVIIAP